MNIQRYLIIPLLIGSLLTVPIYAKNDASKRKKSNEKANKEIRFQQSDDDAFKLDKTKQSRPAPATLTKPKPSSLNKRPSYSYNRGWGIGKYYRYRGPYKNFRNYQHDNRYYYRGRYYSFHDYYKLYYPESNVFYFVGTYGPHDNIFVFVDKYGNEFDLYIKPVRRLPMWFRGSALRPGYGYRMKLNPVRYYPPESKFRVGLTLSFGWGVLQMEKGNYFALHTSPYLINYGGRLYYR